MSTNNNASYNITKSNTIMGFGFVTIAFLIIFGVLLGIVIFDRDTPNEDRDRLLGYVGGFVILFGCLYLIYKLGGRNFIVMGQEIDAGMIAYVVLILLIIFLSN